LYVPFGASIDLSPTSSPPAIAEYPVNQRVLPGSTVIFQVNATGAPPVSYQWLLNGRYIPDATNTTLVFPNVQSNSGGYSALAQNPDGCVVTYEASITVVDVPPFGFRGITRSNGIFFFTFYGETNRLYSLDRSSNLNVWSRWVDFTLVPGYVLPATPDANPQFYRLRTVP
jgi:hypothetical protein